MSPTQRSLADLRARGFLVDTTERWIPRTRIRKDLFGFADLAAISPEGQLVLVQVTTEAHAAHRRAKILATPAYRRLKAKGDVGILLHAWGLRGPRGKKKRWDPLMEWL